MIYVHEWKLPWSGSGRDEREVPWQAGIQVRDIVLGGERFFAFVNGEKAPLDALIDDGDCVVLVPAAGAGIPPALKFAALLIGGQVLGQALSALAPGAKKPKARDDEESQTYGFSRLRNDRAEGQPIAVIYGEHLVSGTVINEFIEVDNSTGNSTYWAITALGEGPVYEIAGQTQDTPDANPFVADENGNDIPTGLFLQRNQLQNYNGVSVWLRLGASLNDSAIPGFEVTKVVHEIDVELGQEEASGTPGNVISLSNYNLVSNEGFWLAHAHGFDVTGEPVDGLDIIIDFPQGLYEIEADTAAAISATFSALVRYCKLDSNGTPLIGFGRGGDNNDGWVYVPPLGDITLKRQSPFKLQIPVEFRNPADAVDPTTAPGDAWNFPGGSGNYIRTSAVLGSLPSSWTDDDEADEFSFESWVYLSSIADTFTLFEWMVTASKGISIGRRYQTIPGIGTIGPYTAAYFGRNSKTFVWTHDYPVGRYFHFVFTFKRLNAGDTRMTMYFDGVNAGTRVENAIIDTGAEQDFAFFGYGPRHSGTSPITGKMDEVVLYDKELSADEVALRYNGGAGRYGFDAPNVFAGYHCDDLTDYSSNGRTASAQGTAAAGSPTGHVPNIIVPPFSATDRGNYRVEVLRINERGDDERIQDISRWELAQTVLNESFGYPLIAKSAIAVEANEQLNTSAPEIAHRVKGRPIKVWDGLSTVSPTFTEAWTRNPAWVTLDVATNDRYGGGKVFTTNDVDIQSFQDLAERCDTRTYDGRGSLDFYRQEFVANGNRLFGQLTQGNWSGSANISFNQGPKAPDGTVTAITIEDDNGAGTEGAAISTIELASGEETYYTVSFFAAKDLTATTYSPSCTIEWLSESSSLVSATWNADTGTPVTNCTVIDYDDNWWRIVLDPVLKRGFGTDSAGDGELTFYPSRYSYGTETPDAAEVGSMTIWGLQVERGTSPSAYPAGPQAFVYVGDKNSSGDPQEIPKHWQPGQEVALADCNHADWDTPSGTTALRINSVQQMLYSDGYTRIWVVGTSWYSTLAGDRPGSTYPNLLEDSREFANIATTWDTVNSTFSAVTDDLTNGPDSRPPLNMPVAEIDQTTALTGFGMRQIPAETEIPLVSGHDYKGVCLAYNPGTDSAGPAGLRLFNTVGPSNQTTANDEWQWLTNTQSYSGNTEFKVEFAGPTSGTQTAWAGACSMWEADDGSGNGPGGMIQGVEALYEYDSVHDTFNDLWDTLVAILETCHAVPVREGNKLRIKIDQPRQPVGMLTQASILADDEGRSSFKYTYESKKNRPQEVMVSFYDRDKNWERDAAACPGTVDPAADTERDTEEVEVIGITRRSQATRWGNRRANVYELIKRSGSFRAGRGALFYEPGDVVVLGHDLVPWGQSGRATGDGGAGDGTVITLDRDIVVTGASNIRVRSTITGLSERRDITNSSGTISAGDDVNLTPALTFVPQAGAEYLVYEDGQEQLAAITSISLNQDLTHDIEWVEYDVNVYVADTLQKDIE